MRKSSIGVAALAVATAGSAVLGGVALASGDFGGTGAGGAATNNCLGVGVNVLSGIGLGGTGVANGASCNAAANGTGGSTY